MKKIIAKWKRNNMYIVFNENTNWFMEIESLYNQKIQNVWENIIQFNPEISLNDDERFFVELNEEMKQEMINPYVNVLDNTVWINLIEKENLKEISVIALVENWTSERLIVTRIFPRYYIKKRFFSFDWEPKLWEEDDYVIFSWDVDVYYCQNRLYFKNYSIARSVFPWLGDFYREATNEEVENFLGNSIFEQNERNRRVSERNRKRIAIVMNNNDIQRDNEQVRNQYIDYAREVGFWDSIHNSKFKVESDKDLAKVLNILDERIYKTPITNRLMEANSVTNIEIGI